MVEDTGRSGQPAHWVVQGFEQSRSRLLAVGYRLLSSAAEAEDAVQETWLRLSKIESSTINNLDGWLTTVVSRISLDMLRSRRNRSEEELRVDESFVANHSTAGSASRRGDPEQEAVLAESVGVALLVVLDRLTPSERISFVLHDIFGLSFEEIASILQRTPSATRQLASRARRRVKGTLKPSPSEFSRQRAITERFLKALRAGDLESLVAVLDPDLVASVDESAASPGQGRVTQGAVLWAEQAIKASRGARFTQLAWIHGELGIAVAPAGKLLRALCFKFHQDRIARIDVVSDPERLTGLTLSVIDAPHCYHPDRKS